MSMPPDHDVTLGEAVLRVDGRPHAKLHSPADYPAGWTLIEEPA